MKFSFFKNLFTAQPKSKSLAGLSGVDYADALFCNLVLEQKVPGISVTVLQNGEPLLNKGYGYSDLESRIVIDPAQSVFRVASVSKCISGLAFGRMVEEGIVHWDDSFYKHVPYFPKKQYDFTLRQLASHTAGIRGYRGKEFALNKPYSIKQSLEVFQNDPLFFKPGKGYLYNSFDFVLLSLAMQEASGTPFEDYVREKVLTPLGMTKTHPPKRPNQSSNGNNSKKEVSYYTKTATGFRSAVQVDNFYKLAGGGYLSTSEDIARMGQAILDGELLRQETYNQLFTASVANGTSTYYGLGFQVSQDEQGRNFVGHVGNSVGAYSNFFVYPRNKIIFTVLTNCSNPSIQKGIDEVVRSTFDFFNLI